MYIVNDQKHTKLTTPLISEEIVSVVGIICVCEVVNHVKAQINQLWEKVDLSGIEP